MLLEAREMLRRRIKFAESDERLDIVGDEADRPRLADVGAFDTRDERTELLVRLGPVCRVIARAGRAPTGSSSSRTSFRVRRALKPGWRPSEPPARARDRTRRELGR